MAIKQPIETEVVPNPLHKFASYTYSWSLWWLDVADFNALSKKTDVAAAMAWSPGPKSYVIAEDSGLYPTRRHPATLGLNYHIQEVNFSSTIGPNKVSKSTNLLTGSMTIVEPYGVTLIDSLVAASFNGKNFDNYTMHPMMLQLEFTGYDDKGRPLSDTTMVMHRKRFPIVMLGMKISVTGAGSQYRIDFCPANAQALHTEFEKVPEPFTIVASTVDEFFNGPNGFTAQYYKNQKGLVDSGRYDFADTIKFDIDPVIAQSKIVYDKEVSLANSNPKGKGISLDKSSFVIPQGTSIVDIITRVMAHSSYLIDLQLGLQDNTGGPVAPKDQAQIFNAFKTLTSVEYSGVDAGGAIRKGVFDKGRARKPMAITYKIHQYPTWNGNTPNIGQVPNSIPYTVKDYNYLYTGKNIDIIDFKVEFNNTYYTAINTYNSQFASTQSTANTDKAIDSTKKKVFNFSPSRLSTFVPQLDIVPTATPIRYKHVIGDPNVTTGMNIKNRPSAQIAADTLKTIYSATPTGNSEMLSVPLTIVGDPTLLKQDDWLYVPSPTASAEYNSWSTQSQAEFVEKYGHLRMDTGQLIVSLTINTPIDMDADITNEGLMWPKPGSRTALFSGQYSILTINNRFAQGKFEQVLNLVRFMNTDFVQSYNVKKQSVRTDTGGGGAGGDADAQEGGFYGGESGANRDLALVPTDTVEAAGDKTQTEDTNTVLPSSNDGQEERSDPEPRIANEGWGEG